MASSTGTVTLNEWCGAEIFQARARTGERLAATLRSGCRVLEKRSSWKYEKELGIFMAMKISELP